MARSPPSSPLSHFSCFTRISEIFSAVSFMLYLSCLAENTWLDGFKSVSAHLPIPIASRASARVTSLPFSTACVRGLLQITLWNIRRVKQLCMAGQVGTGLDISIASIVAEGLDTPVETEMPVSSLAYGTARIYMYIHLDMSCIMGSGQELTSRAPVPRNSSRVGLAEFTTSTSPSSRPDTITCQLHQTFCAHLHSHHVARSK